MSYYNHNWRDAILIQPLEVCCGKQILPAGAQIEVATNNLPEGVDADESEGIYQYLYAYDNGNGHCIGVISKKAFTFNLIVDANKIF